LFGQGRSFAVFDRDLDCALRNVKKIAGALASGEGGARGAGDRSRGRIVNIREGASLTSPFR
jgi:hypothetical protein